MLHRYRCLILRYTSKYFYFEFTFKLDILSYDRDYESRRDTPWRRCREKKTWFGLIRPEISSSNCIRTHSEAFYLYNPESFRCKPGRIFKKSTTGVNQMVLRLVCMTKIIKVLIQPLWNEVIPSLFSQRSFLFYLLSYFDKVHENIITWSSISNTLWHERYDPYHHFEPGDMAENLK